MRLPAEYANVEKLFGFILPAKMRIERPDGQIITTVSLAIDLSIQEEVYDLVREIERECRRQRVRRFLHHEVEYSDANYGFIVMLLSEEAHFKVLLSTGALPCMPQANTSIAILSKISVKQVARMIPYLHTPK